MLGENAEPQFGMFLLIAIGELYFTGEQFEQSGLATTIRTHQSDARVHIDSELHIFQKQGTLLVVEHSLADLKTRRRQLFWIGEVKWLHVVFQYHLFVVHPLQHLYATLHHTGQNLVRSELIDEQFGLLPLLLHLYGLLVVVFGVVR